MTLGLSISAFTTLHVIISLIGIVTGLLVLAGMFGSHRLSFWTAIFLLTTILTSVTGFMFPSSGFTPAQGFGYLSLVLLAIAVLGLYVFHLSGAWRWIYVATAVTALYLNCFVLVVQMFQKLPSLHALAPNQSEPPFQIAQGLLLVAFIVLGILAARRFHPEGMQPAA
jgi:phosphoglycerol transferase MdoB-like AlkP superfamily enzyme